MLQDVHLNLEKHDNFFDYYIYVNLRTNRKNLLSYTVVKAKMFPNRMCTVS